MPPRDSQSTSAGGPRRRGGLGRGLESLIPTTSRETERPDSATGAGSPLDVPIDAISPNPYQPRATMDDHLLQELAASIRTHGVMQPLVVARSDSADMYTLIAGERRWRASRLAGKSTVPVIVKDAAPQAMLELAIIENVVRADLSALEEAHAYKQLIEEFGLTQGDVAERVGRSRVSITNTLRLLNAPDRVQTALADGEITEGHTRALLGLSSIPDQLALLDMILAKALSVRQTEDLVRRWNTPTRARDTSANDVHPNDARIETRMRNALGTRVALKRSQDAAGGTITIHYHSDEQLSELCDRMLGEDYW